MAHIRSDRTSRPRGAAFTLTELTIVVVVLAAVAALVGPRLSSAGQSGAEALLAERAYELRRQIELYRAHHGVYPTLEQLRAAPTSEDARAASFGVLVDEGYVRGSVVNPLTGSGDVGPLGSGASWEYDAWSGTLRPAVTIAPVGETAH